MYAIVEISGKQYKVRQNDRLYIPRQKAAPQSSVTFDRVLLVSNGDEVHVGQPVVDGASVSATVLEHVKADKVLVFKKKRRKHYRVKRGHRQPYTQVLIDGLALDGSAPKKAAPKKAEAKKAEPKKATPKKAEAEKPAPTKAEAPKATPPKKETETPKPAAEVVEEVATTAAAAAPVVETPEPVKEEAPAKAKKKAAKKADDAASSDDLTKIEGIGPKYASVLAEGGLDSFAKLAEASAEQITEILTEASSRYRNAVTETWPEQAALAAKGEWDALDKLQDELDGGRRA